MMTYDIACPICGRINLSFLDGQELIDPKDMLYCFRIRQRSEKDSFISEDKAGNERKISAHEIHLSCESISIKKEDRSYDRAAEPHLPENET